MNEIFFLGAILGVCMAGGELAATEHDFSMNKGPNGRDTAYADVKGAEWSGETRDVQELLEFALAQLGKPYAYGGKGPDKFDCSGFTGYVFRQVDVRLPASAKLQIGVGSPVEKDELLPGDLVFFRNLAVKKVLASHVGIVVEVRDGVVAFIHSSTSRGVTIDDLVNSEHYQVRYIAARRVF